MWTHLITESFCMGETKEEGKYPCGQEHPSHFCLLDNHCPYYAWSRSTIREGAFFVPLHLIVKDKAKAALENTWDNLRWFFWGQLPFNRRKIDELSKSIISVVEELDEDIEDDEKMKMKFDTWIKKVTEADRNEYFIGGEKEQ